MKILIADVLLHGRPHSDWKEGYEFCYAFRNLGHECDVFGPHGVNSEVDIPKVANQYDFVLVTENYPGYSGWKWWNWQDVKIPKLFWAIDTHLVNFSQWILQSNFDFVAFNNPEDINKYGSRNSFFMPYAASVKHHIHSYTNDKTRDIVFVGGLTPERKVICDRFGIECLMAFGPDYVREMQSSKICFNQSISYDINAKYFEILASGSFMLTNYNENFHKFVDYNKDIEKMFYYSIEDLSEKIDYYLKNDDEREIIASRVKDFIYQNHTWENRAKLILEKIKNII